MLLRAQGVWSWARGGCGAGAHTTTRVRLRGGPVRGCEATRLRGCRGEAGPFSRGRRALGGTSGCARAAPALHPRC